MKCLKCNAENPEIAKFCLSCGEKLFSDESDSIELSKTSGTETASSVKAARENEVAKNKKKTKIIILGSIVAVLVIFIVSFIFLLTRCDHDLSDATCEKAPFCSICEKEVGKALGHSWSVATCEVPKTCERCNLIEGESLGHDWDEATCELASTCSRCSKTDGKALGHKIEKGKIIKESTCSDEGLKKGECIRCNTEVEVAIEKKKHVTGDWEIVKEATVDTEGTRIKKCTVCNESVEEESFKLSKEDYKAACQSCSYKEIARNPNLFKGKNGKFYGKVIQVLETSVGTLTYYNLRVAINGSYSTVMLVSYFADENESHILEDDYITMYGEIQGTETYETVMGNEVTIPSIAAKYIDIH